MKNVVLVNALLLILFLSDTYGGRTHDKRIADATPYPLPAGSQLLQDLGFLAFTLPQVEILMPTKKPRGEELTREQHMVNQELHHRRLRIEHVNSRPWRSHGLFPVTLSWPAVPTACTPCCEAWVLRPPSSRHVSCLSRHAAAHPCMAVIILATGCWSPVATWIETSLPT